MVSLTLIIISDLTVNNWTVMSKGGQVRWQNSNSEAGRDSVDVADMRQSTLASLLVHQPAVAISEAGKKCWTVVVLLMISWLFVATAEPLQRASEWRQTSAGPFCRK